MKNSFPCLLILLISFLLSCSENTEKAIINGVITNATDSLIKIGTQTIPISKDGKFTFTELIERPVFLDALYDTLQWTIFLKPESKINIAIRGKSLENIEYTGELASSNVYLLEPNLLSNEINSFFNKNWVKLHVQNQVDYIATIDSLKGLYLKHLSANSKRFETMPKDFIQAWKAEIDFAYNVLILRYPERHFQFTGNKIELSQNTIDYLKSTEVDNLEYFDISGYKGYAKTWIDNQVDILIAKDSSRKHYSFKKMETLLQIIPKMFKTPYLRDFWLANYLKDHIENNGIENSKQYTNRFNAICKTECFKKELEQYIKSVLDARKDHEVMIYKTENNFVLELHVFIPEGLIATEKRPAIVIFHGGGWSIGNASWAFETAKRYSNQGLIGIAAQYRLSNFKDITPIEAMKDVKDVFIWLRAHADSLGIIPNKIAGEGWSAGGHLVVSAAIFADTLSDQKTNSAPNALILTSPALKNDSWFTRLLGTRNIDPKSLSPLENVIEGLPIPPTLILQGRTDRVALTEFAQLFHDKMIASKYYCELVIYENCGHMFTPSNLDDTGMPQGDKEISRKANEKAYEFLKELRYIKK